MRVFFDTDLEGAAGVYSEEMVTPEGKDFVYAYGELAKDIDAAVRGAFDGGADECLVGDGHGYHGLDYTKIDSRVKVSDYSTMFEEENRFDAMMLIGNHAMAGTQNAFLDHTQSSARWFSYSVNGKPTGEIGQSAMQAAYFDAPVILVTGDVAAVAEAHAFLGEVETVAVKRGIGRQRCEMFDPDESRKKIFEAAKRAVERFLTGYPYRVYRPALPCTVELTLNRSDMADELEQSSPRLERIDARSFRWIAHSYLEIMP